MWILLFHIALVFGGPSITTVIETYPTKEACFNALINVWAGMNEAYKDEERLLYTLECVPKPIPKLGVN